MTDGLDGWLKVNNRSVDNEQCGGECLLRPPWQSWRKDCMQHSWSHLSWKVGPCNRAPTLPTEKYTWISRLTKTDPKIAGFWAANLVGLSGPDWSGYPSPLGWMSRPSRRGIRNTTNTTCTQSQQVVHWPLVPPGNMHNLLHADLQINHGFCIISNLSTPSFIWWPQFLPQLHRPGNFLFFCFKKI